MERYARGAQHAELSHSSNVWTPRGPGSSGSWPPLRIALPALPGSATPSAEARQDNAPWVISGAVIVYRLFDIAYAIDLPKAEALWAQRRGTASTRAQLNATPPKAVSFGVAPVEIVTFPYFA